jgi:hypothetical protein
VALLTKIEISAKAIKKTEIAIKSIAERIKKQNKQQAVLIQRFKSPSVFV